jgi:hypothetical protein
MRSERGEVGSFALEPQWAILTPDRVGELPERVIEARLIASFAHGSAHYGPDQGVVSFKSLGEMLRNMVGHRASQQQRAERLVAAPDVTIVEPPNEVAAAHAKRSGALQDESAYGVSVLTEARLEC